MIVYLYPVLALLFLYYSRKYKTKWGLCTPILVICSVICIFCPILYNHPQFQMSTRGGELSLNALLYWFFAFVISLIPLRNKQQYILSSVDKINIHKLNNVSALLIILSFVSIFVYLPHVKNGLDPINFELNKELYQTGELILTDNRIFRTIVNLHSISRSIVSFLWFYYLAYVSGHKYYKILLGISAIVPIVFMTMAKCVRVDTAFMAIQFLVLYYLFKDGFHQETLMKIKKYALIGGVGVLFMMVAFSIMRFSNGNWDWDPLFYIYSYFAESITNFNIILFDNVNITTDGNYNFALVKKYLLLDYADSGMKYKDMYLNKLDYSCWFFLTYIGDLVRDLGKTGSIVFIILFAYFFDIIIKIFYNNRFISTMLLYIYIDFIATGLFYNKYSYYSGNLVIQNLLISIFIISFYLNSKRNRI